MDIIEPVIGDVIELAVTYPVLASLWMSTFLSMPLVKEALFTGKLLHEVFIEDDEDDYDEDVYRLFIDYT